MTHTKQNELQIEDGLIYRLNEEGYNCDEINVTIWEGHRNIAKRSIGAKRVLLCVDACAGLTNEQLESGYIQKIIQFKDNSLKMIDGFDLIKKQAG